MSTCWPSSSAREGEIVGVDMTDEQLATANAHIAWHMRRFGYGAQRPLPQRLYREARRAWARAGKLRRDRVELRDQSLGRQAGGPARRLRSAEAGRRALFRRRLFRPAAVRDECAPIPCSTASAWAARCTGTISCPWPSRPASSIRASLRAARIAIKDEAMRAEARPGQVLLGDLPAVQARRPGAGLRGLRPGGDLQGHLAGAARRLRARRASSDRAAARCSRCAATPGACWPTRALPPISILSGLLNPLWHLPRLRNLDPVCHEAPRPHPRR